MFNFLRNKLKGVISKFSKDVEKTLEEVPEKEEEKKEKIEEKEKIEGKKKKVEEKKREKPGKIERPVEKKEKAEEPQAKTSFFQKLEEKFAAKKEGKKIEEAEEKKEIEKKEGKKEKPKEEARKEEAKKEEEKKHKEEIEKEKEKPEEKHKEEIYKKEKKEEREEYLEKAEEEKFKEERIKIKEELKKEELKKEELKRAEEEKPAEEELKKSLFTKISDVFTKKTLNEKQFDEIFWELEVVLMENNVAVEVVEKIKEDLKNEIVGKPLRKNAIRQIIEEALKHSIESLFDVEKIDLIKKVKTKKPFVILFLGINGSGKTTTIAKIAKLLLSHNITCVIAAADTFRAAAIDQLEKHANNLKVKMIKHQYGADAAAVAFDTIKYAEAHGIDAVLIDTAGRLHSNVNLMEELKKVSRVSKPDMKIFVGEAITGNDCIEQARSFDDAIGIDAIILAKADVDEKGGTAISISHVTRKPIIYLGIGQKYEDLEEFNAEKIVASIGLA